MRTITQLAKYHTFSPGGIESVVREIATYFAEKGCVSNVISLNSPLTSEGLLSFGTVKYSEVSFSSNLKISSQSFSFGYFLSTFKAISEDAIIICHLPNVLPLLALIFKRKRTPIYFFIHADVAEKNKFYTFLYNAVFRRVVLPRDKFIYTSNEYSNHSDYRRVFPNQQFIVLPLFAKYSFIQPSNTSVLSSQADRRRILMVGRLVPYKDYFFAIDLLACLPNNFSLTIVGDGHLKTFLRNYVDYKFSHTDNKVNFLYSLNDIELKAQYEKSDYFLMTSSSRAEAFGLVLLEAMTYKLPVICREIPGSGVLNVLDYGRSGLLLPRDAQPHEAARMLINYVSDPVEVEKRVGYASRRLMANFSINSFRSRLSALFLN